MQKTTKDSTQLIGDLSEFEPFDEGMFNELQEAQLALDSLLVQVTGFRRDGPRMLLAMMQEKQEKEGQAITEAKEKRKAIAGEALDTPSLSPFISGEISHSDNSTQLNSRTGVNRSDPLGEVFP